jgi:myo-inositol-1(or 4)-monophosphatase
LPVTEVRDDYAFHAERLVAALRDAGSVALKFFRGNLRIWTKGKDSPVSEADIAVDELLRERLAQPGIGWLSEESVDDRARLSSRRVFIVDPIDGTRAYIAGKPDWSICAALVEDGRPVAAAIFVPVTDEMFVAANGRGTTCNGKPVAVNDSDNLNGAHVAGPKSYLERLAEMRPGLIAVPKIHSLALRLTRVAQGQIDAAMASVNGRDWDLAAADLLVHEAGGAMTNIAGETLVYNLHDPVHGALLAAGPARHRMMLDLLRGRRQDFN